MELVDLIYNRNYKEAKKLLEKPVGRTLFFSAHLVNTLERITKNGEIVKKNSQMIYIGSPFKKFFDSLKNNDYEASYQYSLICINQAQEKEEFLLYSYLLEDLLTANELNQYICQKGLIDNLSRIEELLEKMPIFDDQEYIDHALELIEVIKQTKEQKLSRCYFAKFVCHKNVEEEFWDAIKKGDYITAATINKIEHDTIKTSFHGKRNQFLYTKLLSLFKVSCLMKPTYKIDTKDKIEYLENLRTQVEQGIYQEAYDYFKQENMLQENSELEQSFKILKKYH